MTAEEEIEQRKRELAAERAKTARFEGELARERAETASLRQMLEGVLRRLGEVEGKLAKDSHNSSKPPSSDGLGRKRVNLRKKSKKQAGHPGRTLMLVETPDEIVRHRPAICQHCQQPLVEETGRVKERRQVHDLPQMRLRVYEHRVQEASQRLVTTVEQIAEWLSEARVQHGDETGVHIGGTLHWLHVNCTPWLTHLAWHQKRGRKAMDDIGIWPLFHGRVMHDCWSSYDAYAEAHSLCGAHLLRDCLYLAEQQQQTWAAQMADHLLAMHHAAQEWRLQEARWVPQMELDEWVTLFRDPAERLCGSTTSCQGRGKQPSRTPETECCQELAR